MRRHPAVPFVLLMLACELPPPEEPVLVAVPPPPATTMHASLVVNASGATPAAQATQATQATTSVTTQVAPQVEVSRGVRVTTFQIRQLLGHYTTLDGKTGLVLDRTVNPPRARIDGDVYVKNLDVRPSLRCCIEYGPLQTDRAVRVIRDADAEPLPVP
jgi:hypothetical protein